MNDIALHSSLYLDSKLMKKLLVLFLLLGTLLPSAEAGVSPEGIRRPRPRQRCRTHGQVVVCKMPRHLSKFAEDLKLNQGLRGMFWVEQCQTQSGYDSLYSCSLD